MLTLLCAAVIAPLEAGAALGPKNSIVVKFGSVTPIEAAGIGCGSTATGTLTLPPARRGVSRAFGIKVVEPKVGDRDQNGNVRATDVRVSGSTITVAMVADSPALCTAESDTPPAEREWVARFRPDILFDRRVQARVRADARRKTAKLRPRSMRFQSGDVLRRIRWTRFGGKTATGVARYRANYPGIRCTPKLCRGHNSRAKIKAYRVRRCPDTGHLEYTRLTVTFRDGLIFGTGNIC